MSNTPLVYNEPDQGFDVVLTNDTGKVSVALPPINNVHIDVAIRRAAGLLRLLEDIKEQWQSTDTTPALTR